jgi:hypothetical protein
VINEPAQLPDVTTPLFKTTPESELAYEEDENKVPPIPTPPVTTKAPVEEDVEDADDVNPTEPVT